MTGSLIRKFIQVQTATVGKCFGASQELWAASANGSYKDEGFKKKKKIEKRKKKGRQIKKK